MKLKKNPVTCVLLFKNKSKSISFSHVQTGFIIGLHTSAGHHTTASDKTLNTWGFLGWLNCRLSAYSIIRVVTIGSCSRRMVYCLAEEPLVFQCFKSFTFVKVLFIHCQNHFRLLAQLLMVSVTTDNEKYLWTHLMTQWKKYMLASHLELSSSTSNFPLIFIPPITIIL